MTNVNIFRGEPEQVIMHDVIDACYSTNVHGTVRVCNCASGVLNDACVCMSRPVVCMPRNGVSTNKIN